MSWGLRLGLGKQMLLAITAVCATVALISFFLLSQILEQAARATEIARAASSRDIIKAEMDDEIEHLAALARVVQLHPNLPLLARNAASKGARAELGQALDPMFKVLGIDTLKIIGQDKQVLYTATKLNKPSREDKFWGIEEALVGVESLASATGSSGIGIYALVPLGSGADISGALALGLFLNEGFLERIAVASDMRISIVDTRGQLVATYSKEGIPETVSADQIESSILLKNEIHMAPMAGDTATAYFSLQVLDQTLIWVVTSDNRAANALAQRQKLLALLASLLVGLCGAALLGWLAHRHARQIQAIERTAMASVRLTLGMNPLEIAIPSGRMSEVASLSSSLDFLTSRWVEHEKKLRDVQSDLVILNAELELKVRARTAKIEESEQRYRKLVEQSSDAILLCGQDKTVLYANQAALAMMQCSDITQVAGCAIEKLFTFEDRLQIEQGLQPLWQQAQRQDLHHMHIVTTSGDQVRVSLRANSYEEHGQLILQMTLRDIAQQRADEVILQDQLRFIDQMLEAIPLPLSVRDTNGLYLRVNQAYETTYQCARGKVRNRSVYDILPYQLATVVAQNDRLASERQQVQVYENTSAAPNGEPRHVLTQVSAIRRSDGSVIGVIAVDTDVTLIHLKEQALRQANADLGVLSQQLLKAQEDERRRIARDLHDQVGQILTVLKMSLQLIGKQPAITSADLTAPLSMAEEVLVHTRSLTTSLHPHILEDLGLKAAIQWLVERYVQPVGIATQLHLDISPTRADPGIELVAFRIVQESLTNVIRHAHASQITIELAVSGGELCVTIADDGDGAVIPVVSPTQAKSLGLASMRERVAEVGGKIYFEAAAPQGTLIRVTLPWQSPLITPKVAP
jgi:two-component system, NarL family, sensor histidine kinase UhpB